MELKDIAAPPPSLLGSLLSFVFLQNTQNAQMYFVSWGWTPIPVGKLVVETRIPKIYTIVEI